MIYRIEVSRIFWDDNGPSADAYWRFGPARPGEEDLDYGWTSSFREALDAAEYAMRYFSAPSYQERIENRDHEAES
jgi:hypothetical protein